MLLKHFVHPTQPALYEIKRDSGRCFLRSPAKASVEKDFYTIKSEKGEKHYNVEIALGKIETKNAPTVQKLIESGVNSICEEERAFLANFFAIQIHRTRVMRSFYDINYQRFLNSGEALKFISQNRKQLESKFAPKEIEQLENRIKNGDRLKEDKNFFVKHGLAPSSPRFAHAVNQMHWKIMTAKSIDSHFVIGDAPVAVRRRGHLTDPYFVGIERADLGAEMYFPLSYNKLLIASWERSRKNQFKVSPMRVTELNKIAIVSSFESVFSPSKDDSIIDLVKKLSHIRVQPPPFEIGKD